MSLVAHRFVRVEFQILSVFILHLQLPLENNNKCPKFDRPKLMCYQGYFTIAAIKAETDPPPGADDRAATSWTNSLTEHEIKGPSELGKQYSMIRSLKNGQII